MKDLITFDQFQALDLRVATIIKAEEIVGADRLIKLTLDLGELGERSLAAGVKEWYAPEEMVGKQIVVVANLEPRTFRGVESQGMMLAADGNKPILLQPEHQVPSGTKIR